MSTCTSENTTHSSTVPTSALSLAETIHPSFEATFSEEFSNPTAINQAASDSPNTWHYSI